MSRTVKGVKGSGHEYWSRKYNGGGKWANYPGKFSKKLANRTERRKVKHSLGVG